MADRDTNSVYPVNHSVVSEVPLARRRLFSRIGAAAAVCVIATACSDQSPRVCQAYAVISTALLIDVRDALADTALDVGVVVEVSRLVQPTSKEPYTWVRSDKRFIFPRTLAEPYIRVWGDAGDYWVSVDVPGYVGDVRPAVYVGEREIDHCHRTAITDTLVFRLQRSP